jgi:hypothetical protein
MAWIESHQELARHPKTRRLARLLDISVPTALGHLHLLWYWALDFAQDGDLGDYEPADVADAMLWEGDAGELWNALVACGFIDHGQDDSGDDIYAIHDWHEYAGRLIEKRQANAERMRQARAKPVPDTKAPRAAHVQRTLHARAGATVPNRTVPNLTGPEPETGDDARTAAAVAPPERTNGTVPKKRERDLGPLVDAFKAAGLSPPKFSGAEARAANELMAHWSPDRLATCWQDHVSGEYGDDFSRRDLSFGYLNSRNRVGNWATWHAETTKSPSPVRAHANGVTLLPREPGVYRQGVRCDCGNGYSIMAAKCPKCEMPKAELPAIAAVS